MSVFQRLVSVPDQDAALVPTYPCGDGDTLFIAATCATSLSVLTVRLFAFASFGVLSGISQTIAFTSSATADYAGRFSGTPNSPIGLAIDGVTLAAVKVDSLTGGPWTIIATVAKRTCSD